MKRVSLFKVLVVASLIASCSNSSPADLVDATPLPAVVSYDANVKPIIDANCVSCHTSVYGNSSPYSFNNYTTVRQSAENGELIQRINRQPSDFMLMPQGGPKLPQNKIDIIQRWIDQGFNQ